MTPIEKLLSKLEDHKQRGNKQWECRCPAHDDRMASLSISVGDDGRALMKCHAGCETRDIVQILGMKMADLMPARNGHSKPIETYYAYVDEDGNEVFQAVRKQFPDGSKKFWQRQRKEGGGWNPSKAGCRVVPYKLDQLTKRSDDTVFIAEGEKDCDRLESIGKLATCNAGGAGKWTSEHSKFLKGRQVVILPDNDDPGFKHAAKVAQSLKGVAASVKLLKLPNLPTKGDVSDWLDAGNTVDEFDRLLADAADWDGNGQVRILQETRNDQFGVITNAKIRRDADGGTQVAPLPLPAIIKYVRSITGGFPKRCGESLFIDDAKHGVHFLKQPSSLFGWLGNFGQVEWHRHTGCCSQSEVFDEFRRVADYYESIEKLPHEPLIEGHYYTTKDIEAGQGKYLEALLNKFNPSSDVDRELMRTAFLTPAWGGPYGARPCFILNSPRGGRGAGKTSFVHAVGEVFGGLFSASPREDFQKLTTRLLSPTAVSLRCGILDNVKSSRMSWSEFEGTLTASHITGHRMYQGEAQRPNTMTWFITLNGVSLSTDLAQRCVIIHIDPPTRTATWQEDVFGFIRKHRMEIIGDCVGILRGRTEFLTTFSRWSKWERDVLNCTADPEAAQQTILERQGDVDVEADEAEEFEEFVGDQLSRVGYSLDEDKVFIPNQLAKEWFCRCTNTRATVTAVSRQLRQLIDEGRFSYLTLNQCRTYGRGFIWLGRFSSSVHTSVDLKDRIESRLNSHPTGH